MFEIDVTAHGKGITFTIDKVQRGYELRQVDEDGDSWRVGVYESVEAAFARAGRNASEWFRRKGNAMTVKEFTGMQSEFAHKRLKFTVDEVPLTVWNFDMLAGKTVVAWGMHADGIIEITTKCEEC